MKILKRIATVFAVVLVLFIVIGLTKRRGWHVERSVVVAAKPATILPFVANLQRWQDWAGWNKLDSSAKWTYAGPAEGAGASMSWTGKQMGEGTLQITSADAGGVHYVVTLEGRYPGHGVLTFEPGATRTKVLWVDEGDMKMNLLGRFMIGSIEDQLGRHYATALEQLKLAAEKQEGTTAAAPVAVPAVAH